MANRRRTSARSGKPYVSSYTDPVLEHSLTQNNIDLLPWVWYALGWHSSTLPVWLAFAKGVSPENDDRVRTFFRSIPATTYYIRTAAALLGDRLPSRVRGHIIGICDQLEQHNDVLARGGEPPAAGQQFESGTAAVARLQSAVNGLDGTAAANQHWLAFGRRLGLWYTHEQFHTRPLAASVTELIEMCREMPRSTATSAPPIAELVRLVAEPGVPVEQLARSLCRRFDATGSPEEELDDTLVTVRLFVAVFMFASQVHASLLQKRLTPRWVKDLNQGTLWFRDVIVRTTPDLTKAKNIVPILDSFEEEGWPRWIYSPLRNNSNLLQTTLNQLREHLKPPITFVSAGKGKCIEWVNMEQPADAQLAVEEVSRRAAQHQPNSSRITNPTIPS